MYVRDTCFRLPFQYGSSDVLPVHLQDWSSFLLQNISSDAETMLPHPAILLSDLQDHRSSIPVYVPEYPCCGTSQLCSAIIYQTTSENLPVCRQQSFPAFQTDEYDIRLSPPGR